MTGLLVLLVQAFEQFNTGKAGHSYVSYDQVGFVAPKTFQSFRCGHRFADLVGGVG